MAQWLSGSVAQWLSGSVAQWLSGSVAKRQGFETSEVYSRGFKSCHRKHKATVNSGIRLSDVGKSVLRSNSEGTSTGYTLIAAN